VLHVSQGHRVGVCVQRQAAHWRRSATATATATATFLAASPSRVVATGPATHNAINKLDINWEFRGWI
jgi:hypothetical protein